MNQWLAIPPNFFVQDTLTVARHLLGQVLVVREGDIARGYQIIETEAYTQEDPACHAFKGPTKRAKTLFERPGLSYVYLIYGMYHCLNVVTEPEGRGCAVLFRAISPLNETDRIGRTDGPGRLCKTLGITTQDTEMDLTDQTSRLFLAAGSLSQRRKSSKPPALVSNKLRLPLALF